MKKIIEGKIYNTETAELVETWHNGFSSTDFNRCSEYLYKTKNGAFFLHGDGGAMSRWAESFGDTRSGGEGIVAMTTEEALAWCEERDADPDLIADHFPDQLEEA